MFPSSLRILRLRTGPTFTECLVKKPRSYVHGHGLHPLPCRLRSTATFSRFLAKPTPSLLQVNVKFNGLQQILERSFRTTSPRAAVPPILIIAASKLGKYLAVFLGRHFRVWYKNLPAETKTEYVSTAKRHRTKLYTLPEEGTIMPRKGKSKNAILGTLGLCAYYYYYTHLCSTPITNRKRFVIFNDEQIDEISKHELDILVDTHREKILDKSHPSHKQVYRVATKLLEANKDLLREHGKDKNWTITVVEDKLANAFVLSCGSIFVFSGLLELCADEEGDSDSRLAIILGHELSHVLLNHSAEQASFLHLLDMILIVPVLALWALLPTDATTVVSQYIVGKMTDLFLTLPFGRSLEAEADHVGLLLSARACFDIRECVIWKKMQLMNQSEINVELFSTHPSEENRFESLQEQLPAALAIRNDCKCPKLSPFDLQKRIESIEQGIKKKNKMEDVLVPIKIDLSQPPAKNLPPMVLTK